MSVDEIVAYVEELLASPDGKARSTRVLDYLEALGELRADDEKPLRIRMRKGMLFFATVGKLLDSRVKLDVRIRGRLVGEVQLRAAHDRVFKPVDPWKMDLKKERAEWGHSSVLAYLRQRERELSNADTEAKVQSALFAAMRETRGANKLESLRRNQPVQMLGLPFQFPLPVSASESRPKVSEGNALGHADVLARSGAGHRLKVFEIKKPGGGAAQALAQGVAYAAALVVLLRTKPSVMFRALGYSKPRGTLPKLEVWAFVDLGDAPAVRARAVALQKSNHYFDLHLMPYEMTEGGELRLHPAEALGLALRGT